MSSGQSCIVERPMFERKSAATSLHWATCILNTVAAGDVLQTVAVGEFFCCNRPDSSSHQMSSFFMKNVYFVLGNVMHGRMNFFCANSCLGLNPTYATSFHMCGLPSHLYGFFSRACGLLFHLSGLTFRVREHSLRSHLPKKKYKKF